MVELKQAKGPANSAKPAPKFNGPKSDDSEDSENEQEAESQSEEQEQQQQPVISQTPTAQLPPKTGKTFQPTKSDSHESSQDSQSDQSTASDSAGEQRVTAPKAVNDQPQSRSNGKPRQKEAVQKVDATADTTTNPVNTTVNANAAVANPVDTPAKTTTPSTPVDANAPTSPAGNLNSLPDNGLSKTNRPNVSFFKSEDDSAANAAATDTTSQLSASTIGTDVSASSPAPAASVADSLSATRQHVGQAIGTALESAGATILSLFDQPVANHTSAVTAASTPATPDPTQTPAQVFAGANHETIVSSIHGQLLPGGGTMQIRLDPPELGALQVSVKVQNGVISASFETSNENATQLLSHSLGQLKHALESQGISVGRLHVQQAPRSESSDSSKNESRDGGREGSGRQSATDQRNSRQEEQRREIIRRMWRRVSGGRDPLDLVA